MVQQLYSFTNSIHSKANVQINKLLINFVCTFDVKK